MMTGKVSKRARNPQAVDNWLDSLELYRKSVAYDETCLFRAVSEELFDCQVFHERVRVECIEYGRKHCQDFIDMTTNTEEWLTHLERLEKHMVVCGEWEINLISHTYNRDVLIVYANQKQIINITNRDIPSPPLMFCLMDDDHYDAVYKKSHIINSGFCQSLIYKVLYEDVFSIPNVDKIVEAMLYEKVPVINQSDLEENKKRPGGPGMKPNGLFENAIVAPFPFKVAKALDPTIYRNIEYDSWNDVRKELRLGDWYKGDDKLKLGTKCVLTDSSGEILDCYIQRFHQDDDKCIVYITKIAEKRLVKYTDLAPENNAKPWPLPYRFTKNLVLRPTPKLAPMEKVRAMRKRDKEAKQQSKSVSDLPSIGKDEHTNVSGFIGAPLQMQSSQGTAPETTNTGASMETVDVTLPCSEGLMTPLSPECGQFLERCHWDQVNNNWSPSLPPLPLTPSENMYYPTTPDPCLQSQAASVYDYKPLVASAPVTPNVISYHDTSYPFYFNFHVPHYPQYPITPITPVSTPITPNAPEMFDREMAENMFQRIQSQPQVDMNTLQGLPVRVPQTGLGHGDQVSYVSHTPQQVEMYSSSVNLPPGPPLIYTPVSPTNVAMVIPSSPSATYGPSTPILPHGYMYSPNEPASQVQWYSTGGLHHNAQGFIFPTPNLREQ